MTEKADRRPRTLMREKLKNVGISVSLKFLAGTLFAVSPFLLFLPSLSMSLFLLSLPSPNFYSLIEIDSRREEFAFQFNSLSSYSVPFVDSSLSITFISDDHC